MIAELVYAAAWVFDIAFATWIVARLWEAADESQPTLEEGLIGRETSDLRGPAVAE